jgi:hypothetical protein
VSPAAVQFDTTRYTSIIINRILGDLGRWRIGF